MNIQSPVTQAVLNVILMIGFITTILSSLAGVLYFWTWFLDKIIECLKLNHAFIEFIYHKWSGRHPSRKKGGNT